MPLIAMQLLFDSISFIRDAKRNYPAANKAYLQQAFVQRYSPRQVRSVFIGQEFAMRFSEARSGSFSNTVLSLSALHTYDTMPFVVAVVRSGTVEFLLANSTFLKRISHSSRDLRVNNIRGSFNGTDIMLEYEGVRNAPENFEQLFAQHSAFTWDENVRRLVESTNAIVGRDNRFHPTVAELAVLLAAPERAQAALSSPEYGAIEHELLGLVEARHTEIIQAATLDNVNLRGNAIEQIITGDPNAHELGDLIRTLNGGPLVIDIKTKLLNRASAPKAYNVDKMLAFLARPGSVFALLIIAVDLRTHHVSARLLPVLEQSLLNATGVQHHWAGRASRGVTQLSGDFGAAINANYQPVIDLIRARAFLQGLIAI